MTIIHSIILGIVEGLTEFLPISSTGHLIVFSNLLNIEQNAFLKSFEVFIQLGAIMAVLFIYIKKILNNKNTILNIIYAFIPTAVIGFLFYQPIKILMGNVLIVPIVLILGGIVIIIAENFIKKNSNAENKTINKKEAFILGTLQTIAFIPGVSRSGALIISGLLRNISRKDIVEFSFLLALPTMAAATGYDIIKNGFSFTQNEWLLITIGFITSFLIALIAIKTFIKFISHNTFKVFGWYRIFAGIIFLFLLAN